MYKPDYGKINFMTLLAKKVDNHRNKGIKTQTKFAKEDLEKSMKEDNIECLKKLMCSSTINFSYQGQELDSHQKELFLFISACKYDAFFCVEFLFKNAEIFRNSGNEPSLTESSALILLNRPALVKYFIRNGYGLWVIQEQTNGVKNKLSVSLMTNVISPLNVIFHSLSTHGNSNTNITVQWPKQKELHFPISQNSKKTISALLDAGYVMHEDHAIELIVQLIEGLTETFNIAVEKSSYSFLDIHGDFIQEIIHLFHKKDLLPSFSPLEIQRIFTCVLKVCCQQLLRIRTLNRSQISKRCSQTCQLIRYIFGQIHELCVSIASFNGEKSFEIEDMQVNNPEMTALICKIFTHLVHLEDPNDLDMNSSFEHISEAIRIMYNSHWGMTKIRLHAHTWIPMSSIHYHPKDYIELLDRLNTAQRIYYSMMLDLIASKQNDNEHRNYLRRKLVEFKTETRYKYKNMTQIIQMMNERLEQLEIHNE